MLWLIAVLSRLLFNGSVLGFDYTIYQPDGANYTFRTLSFISATPLEAATKVSEWYATHGFKHNIINPTNLLPENSPVWYLSAPRILYPLLSIPFVLFLGIPGMLVIPALSLLAVMFISHQIAKSMMRPEFALLFNFVLIASTSVLRWFIANLTDGLLALLIGLIIIVEIKVKKIKIWILFVVAIVLLASATRFSVPIFMALGIGYVFIKEKSKAIALFVSSFCGALPLIYFGNSAALLPGTNEESLSNKILNSPLQSLKVLVVEIGQLLVLDRIFLLLVVFSIFCAYQLKNKVGVLTLAVLMGVLAVGFINGSLGVNFRYQLPLIPFMSWSFINYLKLVSSPGSR